MSHGANGHSSIDFDEVLRGRAFPASCDDLLQHAGQDHVETKVVPGDGADAGTGIFQMTFGVKSVGNVK
jgi:hypothetical protein